MGGKYWRDQTRAIEHADWTDATTSAATATRAATGAKNFQKRYFLVKPVWRSRGHYTQGSRLQLQLPKRDVRRHQFGKVIGSSARLQLITALSCSGFWVSSGARQWSFSGRMDTVAFSNPAEAKRSKLFLAPLQPC
jgi:hypothetical protein